MNLFLTSSPTGDLDGKYRCDGLDDRNQFATIFRNEWTPGGRILMIASSPDVEKRERNNQMKAFFRRAILKSGMPLRTVDLWDGEILEQGPEAYSSEVLKRYEMIILCGGHVPTQNAFFQKLNLRENIKGYEGIVLGISAGSMNAADEVYVQPELPGEAADPDFNRFAPGLGLTEINILPHYQMVKHDYIDGKHLFNDISIPDSDGHTFMALVDGSFIHCKDGVNEVYGESYMIKNGTMKTYTVNGQHRTLKL